VLSVYARHGAIGFRPKWSTPRDDAGETHDEKRTDDGCPPVSTCLAGGSTMLIGASGWTGNGVPLMRTLLYHTDRMPATRIWMPFPRKRIGW